MMGRFSSSLLLVAILLGGALLSLPASPVLAAPPVQAMPEPEINIYPLFIRYSNNNTALQVVAEIINHGNKPRTFIVPQDGSLWGWLDPKYLFTVTDATTGAIINPSGRCGMYGGEYNEKTMHTVAPGKRIYIMIDYLLPYSTPQKSTIFLEYGVSDPPNASNWRMRKIPGDKFPDTLYTGLIRSPRISVDRTNLKGIPVINIKNPRAAAVAPGKKQADMQLTLRTTRNLAQQWEQTSASLRVAGPIAKILETDWHLEVTWRNEQGQEIPHFKQTSSRVQYPSTLKVSGNPSMASTSLAIGFQKQPGKYKVSTTLVVPGIGRATSNEIDVVIVRNPMLAKARPRHFRLPLHAAATWGEETMFRSALKSSSVETVLAWLARRPSVAKAEPSRWHMPLLLAAEHGRTELIEPLLKHGAKVNTPTSYGLTPLHQAAYGGHLETVKMLITKGANAKAVGNGWTLLHYAARAPTADVMQHLVRTDRTENVNVAGGRGDTPLHVAAESGVPETVKVLLKHGAAVDTKNIDGQQPLLRTASEEAARLLLEHGADVNVADQAGRTPLLHASPSNPALALLYLKAGARTDVQGTAGHSLLHYAVYGIGQPKEGDTFLVLANRLVALGLDVNAQDKKGNTPLHFVASRTDPKAAIEFLLNHGANLYAKNAKGRTPLDVLRVDSDTRELAKTLSQRVKDKVVE